MSSAPDGASAATLVDRAALLACLVLVALVVWLAAGPLTTNDLWWHLAHGRAFAAEGPWLDEDPCLATATRGAVPHSWLFGVAAAAVEGVAGLHGLRVVHALAVVGVALLAFGVFRRATGRVVFAALGVALFFVLSWYRLIQLRPELFSIAAVLVLERVLLAKPVPSWRAVLAAVGTIGLWANVHAAFLVGPLLVAAASGGALLEAATTASQAARTRALRLGSAFFGGLLAALLNPRGHEQHLAFWRSNREGEIFRVVDEWAPFDPFGRSNVAPAVSDLAWVVTDLMCAAFLVVLVWRAYAWLRARSDASMQRMDPVRLALGVAGCVALLASIRFAWLAVFPLLVLLGAASRSQARAPARLAALLTVVVAVAFPLAGGFRTAAAVFPSGPAEWWTSTHTGERFFDEGTRFLAETGVRGTLFHPYGMGGYLCHRLGPALRTFVDGSMNVPDEVSTDYRKVMEHAGARPGESAADVLRRREVDLFFGVGVPAGPLTPGTTQPYTTGLLEGVPGWLLVSRSMRHAIYLRDDAANRENRARIAAWYAGQGVPFSPSRGLDPGAVLAEAPGWARDWRLAPAGFEETRAAAQQRTPGRTAAALETLGLAYALAGAYDDAIATARDSMRRRPRAKEPRQRLVYALLHAGADAEARVAAEGLLALDPNDMRSRAFAGLVERAARAPTPAERNAVLADLPLLSQRRPLRQ